MFKKIFTVLSAILLMMATGKNATAQKMAAKKKITVETKVSATPAEETSGYTAPVNVKDKPVEKPKTRGDVYGPNYSDIIYDNWTGYYIEVWVDGSYRTTVRPWGKITTWAEPGTTRLVGIARFDDGSTKTWGPSYYKTGYEFTWKLTSD